MTRFLRLACVACALASHFSPDELSAQWQSNSGVSSGVIGAPVGGDVERYIRALALAGLIAPVPWAARPFDAADVTMLVGDTNGKPHPWRTAAQSLRQSRVKVGAALHTSANSGFAWGSNDGSMWQGRGLNAAAGIATSIRLRFMSVVAAPLAFVAQNSAFPILPKTIGAASIYASSLYPNLVDLPQRMGGGAYARVDPGESSVLIHLPGVNVGVSTASEGWGTGDAFPALLGANAGGFPHVVVGTRARGIHLPQIGRVTARYILGTLSQSDWSSVHGSHVYEDETNTGTLRVASGLAVSYMPAVLPTLELGASRFFHSPYRRGSSRWVAWSKPFEGLFKADLRNPTGGDGDPNGDADNQLAAFFARWVFPQRGVEANVELFRDDHNWDSRDLAQEPENNSAVLASIRAVTRRRADLLSTIALEYFDGDVRPIAQARAQGYLYLNGGLRQGHTLRGQLLGAPIGVGAIAGQRVAWESFRTASSTRLQVQRWRTQSLPSENPEALFLGAERAVDRSHDWLIDVSAGRTRYRRRGAMSYEAGLVWAGVWNFGDPRANVYARTSWSFF